MPLFNLSVKHGRTLEDARNHLEQAVKDVRDRFGTMVQRVEWSDDRSTVHLSGSGAEVEVRVDAQEVHAVGDMSILGNLLGAPLLLGLQGILQQHFRKRLT